MPETPQPRRLTAALALSLTALVIVGVYLAVPDDPERRPLVVNLIDAVAWFMGGVVLLSIPRFAVVVFPALWGLSGAGFGRKLPEPLVTSVLAAGWAICAVLFVNWRHLF
jgi:hypothetical protein